MLIPWSAEPLRNALLWISANAGWNVGSTICPISWKLCTFNIKFVTGLKLIALERFLACWSLVKTLPICAPSLSSFGPDRFLSVSLSESGLAGRLNQRRELGCFVKSELQGGHKLRYNFPCGQFQVNSEIRCCEKFPADSATAIMRKLQDIKLSQQMDLPPSWFVWCQQNWLSRDTLCFVGNTLRPRILVDAEFVQISNASAISSRSLHIKKNRLRIQKRLNHENKWVPIWISKGVKTDI